MKVNDRKTKIARLRKIVKGVCSSLRVRRGRGTAGAWVKILSSNAGAEFSDQEKAALNHLGIPRVANSASIAPKDLDATLRWLEARYGGPPPTDDMIQVASRGAVIGIAQSGDGNSEPFCVCGRRLSECDGSRAGCGQSKSGPKAEFTPGPWAVVQPDHCQEILVRQVARPSVLFSREICSIEYYDEEASPNAHLIAAAPDQNDVLKQLAERIEECRSCGGTGQLSVDCNDACGNCGGTGRTLDATSLVQDIEDALAKATGGDR